ncbi:MAG: hypothetical protein K2J78_14210 [Muribaculaceae bacterium]|nr:hypothetical protein [Muribaculaceae bacterium]
MAKDKSDIDQKYNANSPRDIKNKDTFDVKDLESFTLFDPTKDDKADITEKPGNYAILLRQGSKLPDIGVSNIPCLVNYKGELYELIYVGRSEDSLRNREYDKYFTRNNSGQSTFRKSVGAMMDLTQTYRSKGEMDNKSPKTKFTSTDEALLTEWIKNNLLFLFKPYPNPKQTKTAMVQALDPILNLEEYPEHSLNIPFRKALKKIRKPTQILEA